MVDVDDVVADVQVEERVAGLRASVMLHLPALVMTGQIEKVFQAVS